METTFQPQVRVSDKSTWTPKERSEMTTTELLLDMLRMLTEMNIRMADNISSTQALTQHVKQATEKLDGE